jgi:hypothetical protein
LKKFFILALVICYFDPERKFVVEIDASNLTVMGILSQSDNDSILHSVAYCSRKYSLMEINYEIHDKELLAIFHAFKEWLPLLRDSLHTIEVSSDY